MHFVVEQAVDISHFGQLLGLLRQHGGHRLFPVAFVYFFFKLPFVNLALAEQPFFLLYQSIFLLEVLFLKALQTSKTIYNVEHIKTFVFDHRVDFSPENSSLVLQLLT